MDEKTRNAAIAAALILGGFGLVAFFMPTIMLSLGEVSPFLAAVVAALFVLAFFGVFWLRSRAKRGD
jgi:hypothetical protein